jgi:hypothetical protein
VTQQHVITAEQVLEVLADAGVCTALERLASIGVQVYLPQPLRIALEAGMVPQDQAVAVAKTIGAMRLVSYEASIYIDKRTSARLERVPAQH